MWQFSSLDLSGLWLEYVFPKVVHWNFTSSVPQCWKVRPSGKYFGRGGRAFWIDYCLSWLRSPSQSDWISYQKSRWLKGSALSYSSFCLMSMCRSTFHHELIQHKTLTIRSCPILDIAASRTMSQNKLIFFINYLNSGILFATEKRLREWILLEIHLNIMT
jgi:hypothetical protein